MGARRAAPPLDVLRCDVPSVELLRELVNAPLPLGLTAAPARKTFHRDVYLDTPMRSLHERGVICRLRLQSDDRRILMLAIRNGVPEGSDEPPQRFDAEVPEVEPLGALSGESEPARRLRGLVNPAHLEPSVELEVERHIRVATGRGRPAVGAGGGAGAGGGGAKFEFGYDIVTVRLGGISRTLQEIKIRRQAPGEPTLEDLAVALQDEHGIRLLIAGRLERARLLLDFMESEGLARAVGSGRSVAVIALHDGRIACRVNGASVSLPVSAGSGEKGARFVMRRQFGTAVGELQLIGTVPASERRPLLEVWLAHRIRRESDLPEGSSLVWLRLDELMSRAGTPALRDPETLAALIVAARSDMLVQRPSSEIKVVTEEDERATDEDPRAPRVDERKSAALPRISRPTRKIEVAELETPVPDTEQFLNGELSLVDFNTRVLAMAEDRRVPIMERMRYLAIVSANLDEFFQVRVGGLKRSGTEVTEETAASGQSPAALLDAIAVRVRALVTRQYRCFFHCRSELTEQGIRILAWQELNDDQREYLRRYFEEKVFPLLTPKAITLSSGFPFPVIAPLALSIAVIVKELGGGPSHFAHVKVPKELGRFVQLPDSRDFVPIEAVVQSGLALLFPESEVQQAQPFRITRSGELDVDERQAGDLLQAIEEEASRRRFNPVVRVEVERGIPNELRVRLLQELQFDPGTEESTLSVADIYDVDGPLDLTGLRELGAAASADMSFEPFRGRDPLPVDRSLFEMLRRGDVLFHYPYENFDTTAARLFTDSAVDPDVAVVKLTLYRVGEQSAMLDSLLGAAEAGKEVVGIVELKARFDEEQNVSWAKKLENAGGHVVYGLPDIKNHAKVALIVRRDVDAVRRYVYIGTGNFNPVTSRLYTDLGMMSADEELGADLNDLLNMLTGSPKPPEGQYRQLLVAPHSLLPGLLERIQREAEHARAGRGGRIRIKVNGLSDSEVIRALYHASQAGVEIDLIVRSICTLRPGVPGLSENIRVVSILGRFLEHARIFHFGNAGNPEYFIGSADLRPRNLRRRVEVLAPVRDARARERLERILELECEDPTAWELGPDGEYLQRWTPRVRWEEEDAGRREEGEGRREGVVDVQDQGLPTPDVRDVESVAATETVESVTDESGDPPSAQERFMAGEGVESGAPSAE